MGAGDDRGRRSAPPTTTNDTMPPKPRICRGATSWPGWVAQAGPAHLPHRGVVEQELGDDRGPRRRVAVHADGERLAAPAARGSQSNGDGTDAGGVRRKTELLGQLVVVDVATKPPTTSLCPPRYLVVRVDDDVGAERQRALQVGGGERVVDDAAAAPLVGQTGQGARCRRWTAAGCRGLDPDQAGAVRPRGGDGRRRRTGPPRCAATPSRPVDLVDQAPGAAVGVVGDDQRGRRAAASGGGRPRPPCPLAKANPWAGALEHGERVLRTVAGRVAGAGVLVRGLARLVLGEGRGQGDGRDDGAGRRIGVLAAVDGPGLEACRSLRVGHGRVREPAMKSRTSERVRTPTG